MRIVPAAKAALLCLLCSPAGATELSLRLAEPHAYHAGELIRAEVHLSSPGESWQFAGFLLDPAGDCGSLAAPCFWRVVQQGMMSFNNSEPTLRLGRTSDPVALSLNNYLPVLPPGRYRAAILIRKLDAAGLARDAVSNTVDLEVIPATEAWRKQAIASSAMVLKGPPPGTMESYEQRLAAADQLRCLDTPAAWSASLAALPAEENILLRGLTETGAPAQVCELMKAAVPAPSQAVSSRFLFELGRVCAQVKPADLAKVNAVLAESISQKQGEAKPIAFETLMESLRQIRWNEPRLPPPAWIPGVKQEFMKSYSKLDPRWQRQLLSFYSSTLHSPDLIPLLESVLDAWKPGDYYEAPREALQCLYDLDPTLAQKRIVAELAKERSWLDPSQLALLPVSVAPFTDDALLAALASPGVWNPPLRTTALAKYASPQALPRIQAIYESQPDSCQPELLAYFVRVDPAYADRVFHSHPWDMLVKPPPCTFQYFQRTPPIAMGPVLERYLAAYLMHSDVLLKRTAAQSLARFGSPAAAGPLWGAFRYFHGYWKGKQAELARNNEGVQLELDLRNAIARGRQWLATEEDLHTIAALCISGQCLGETQQDLQTWQKPLKVEVNLQSGGIRARVAQYYGIEALDALEEKLGQFPKGTRFTLIARGDGADGVAARLQKYASTHGFVLITSPSASY